VSAHARQSRRTQILGLAGVVLLVGGITAVVIAFRAQQVAPQPPASAAVPVSVGPAGPPQPRTTSASTPAATPPGTPPLNSVSRTAGSGPSNAPRTTPSGFPTASASTSVHALANRAPGPPVRGPILEHSLPVHLSIPAIHVDSDLKTIGLANDGTIQTPPLVRDSHAYWLDVSPTPGQLGPSVILGHVDSAAWGPAVFFDLGQMRQRDIIEVTRADHTVAVFQVTHVNEYSKQQFPTDAVYGNTDDAALRLMTCGGTFDYSKHSYESNIVVYAALVSTHHT
jgi:sortase (surface protein transpeptidase)